MLQRTVVLLVIHKGPFYSAYPGNLRAAVPDQLEAGLASICINWR